MIFLFGLKLPSGFVYGSDIPGILTQVHYVHLQGNQCRELWKNLDSLESIIPLEHCPYLAIFWAFDALAPACLDPYLKQYVADFKFPWLALTFPITCKVHLILENLGEEVTT